MQVADERAWVPSYSTSRPGRQFMLIRARSGYGYRVLPRVGVMLGGSLFQVARKWVAMRWAMSVASARAHQCGRCRVGYFCG